MLESLIDCCADKEMPVMDGHEATRKLRERGITIPIVAVTGNALEADKEVFLKCGANEFMAKPCRKAQVEAMLNKFLVDMN